MRALLLLSVVLAVGGCGVFIEDDRTLGPIGSYEVYLEERAALEADLARLIGEAEAGDLGSCRAVAVGTKACGGPVSYAVYSVQASDGLAVERRAQMIRDLDAQANREFELVSTCDVTPEPTGRPRGRPVPGGVGAVAGRGRRGGGERR